jgi:hypothetical protein
MSESGTNTTEKYVIITPEEVAQYLRKSSSWVYKNQKVLGGRKLGGSLFFPRKEELYERIFCERERMEVRLHPEPKQVHKDRIQNKGKSQKRRSKKKGGNKQSENRDNSNRHEILGNSQ